MFVAGRDLGFFASFVIWWLLQIWLGWLLGDSKAMVSGARHMDMLKSRISTIYKGWIGDFSVILAWDSASRGNRDGTGHLVSSSFGVFSQPQLKSWAAAGLLVVFEVVMARLLGMQWWLCCCIN